MAQQNPLNVQCFVKKDFQSAFVGETTPSCSMSVRSVRMQARIRV